MDTVEVKMAIVGWADSQPHGRSGALLSVRETRVALGDPAGFGEALLALADEGRVYLHHADHPDMAPQGVDNPTRLDHAGRPSRVIGYTLRW
jgi:hypothetical protein